MTNSSYKIYPKQFRNEKIPIEKNRCFFIMPFAEEFDIVYGAIKNSLSDSEYICTRVDEISGSTPIINKILVEILKAQFIVADLTGSNPNVFYELGVAHTFKDAQNIFLIKEKGVKVPFDITHLTYIEYDKRNLKYMISQLKQSMSENKYISEFYEALNVCGIIDYAHENQDEFIEILKDLIGPNMPIFTDILNFDDSIDADDAEHALSFLRMQIKKCLNKLEYKTLCQVLNFYYELLLASNRFKFVEYMSYDMMDSFFDTCNLSEKEIISLTTDFALKFARACKQVNIVMPWIISYFKKSKSATVDLNRYKLESFLLTTNFKEVNEIICDAMRDKDCHVREHLADIIGEKKLHQAAEILGKQLIFEGNYHTAVSIIAALGKLNSKESLALIKEWLATHEEDIISTKNFFVLKHMRIAIAQIDRCYLEEFENKYIKYLSEFIL